MICRLSNNPTAQLPYNTATTHNGVDRFTSLDFTDILTDNSIRISMDGQGRWRDNVLIERLWKTVKYEEVYLKAYESITHAKRELGNFFDRYNMRRPHQSLDDRTPDDVYLTTLPKAKEAV